MSVEVCPHGYHKSVLRHCAECERGREVAELEAENLRLRKSTNAERRGTASKLRDIAGRIGVAASPQWVRGELEALANQLEVWARGPSGDGE
jgi:hypothetical protein